MAGRAREWTDEEQDLMRDVGARLRARRQLLGMRQADVARRAGMTQGTVSAIEAGAKPAVSLLTVYRIASALALPLHRIIPGPREVDMTYARRWVRQQSGRPLADVDTLDFASIDPDDGRAASDDS